MKWTREKIVAWQEECFGIAIPFRVACRAHEEMSELLEVWSHYEKRNTVTVPEWEGIRKKLLEEMADVCIVLAYLCNKGRWVECGWVTPGNYRDHIKTAVLELARVVTHPEDGWASVVCRNLVLAARDLDMDLLAAIDEKMEKNLARTWNKDGSGCGYHRHVDGTE